MTGFWTKPLRAAITAVPVLALAGCLLVPQHGQSSDILETSLEKLGPVVDATVEITYGPYSGLTRSASTTLDIVLSDDYSVADPEAVLRWALQTVWSINDEKPTTTVGVALLNPDGTMVDWDWESAVTALGYDPEDIRFYLGLPSNHGELTFSANDALVEKMGSWPADVPPLPESAFTEK